MQILIPFGDCSCSLDQLLKCLNEDFKDAGFKDAGEVLSFSLSVHTYVRLVRTEVYHTYIRV